LGTAIIGLLARPNRLLDELGNNPTLSIATYIRGDQPVTWTGSEILVPVEKVRVIGGVIRKFRGNLRIRYALENGRFWLTALQEENFSADVR
jgi:conjugal transfer pilus assembly protein TraE